MQVVVVLLCQQVPLQPAPPVTLSADLHLRHQVLLLQDWEMLKGTAGPDKELLPLWCFKLKCDIIVEVLQLWQLLEVDPLDVWEWRRCYGIIRMFVEDCLEVGAEKNDQNLQ